MPDGPKDKPSEPGPRTLPARPPLSQAELLRAAERSGLVFFHFESASGRLSLSDSCKEVLGYASSEFVADAGLVERLLGKAGFQTLKQAVKDVKEGRSDRAQAVLPVQAKDGRDVWLNCTFFGVHDPAGAFVGLDGVAMDATELVRARRRAEEAHEVFRVMFEEGPMPAVLFDPKTLVIQRANARAAALLGVRHGDLHGAFISEFLSPDEWPRIREHLAGELATKGVAYLQRTVGRKLDGTLFPVQAVGVNLEIEGKACRLTVFRDLSDTEAAAEQVKNVYRALDASPTPTLMCDSTMTIAHANAAALKFIQRDREDLLGRELAYVFDPATALRLQEQQPALFEGRPFQGECALRTKTGGLERASFAVTPVLDSRGEVQKVFASFSAPVDGPAPSGQTPAEAGLFFDLLAHDTGNYLTAVRGYLELMVATGNLPEGALRMAGIAKAQASNALELIRDTRTVVSLQRDPNQSRATGDLTKVLDEAVARVEPILQARRFRVRKEYRVSQARVRSPDLLREVVVNLLHNAVKFDRHEEVLLDILLEKAALGKAPAFYVRVSDRGVGIPDADKPHLFERGFRPSNAPARRGDAIAPPGSGIGLSLCKFIVQRAGGEISVENRIPGDATQGSAFVILLPAA